MTPHQRWTQTDITDLRAQLQAGATAADIVAATGRAPSSVDLMVARLRLRYRRSQ